MKENTQEHKMNHTIENDETKSLVASVSNAVYLTIL